MAEDQKMKDVVANVPEKELLETVIRKSFSEYASGLRDDAAVLRLPGYGDLILTIDKIIERPLSLDSRVSGYFEMGYFLGIINLSDLAAMGAKPLGLLVSYGLPPDFPVSGVKEMSDGLAAVCHEYDSPLLGGDVNPSASLSLVGAAVGICKGYKPMMRCGAQKGDFIFTTGDLGLYHTAILYFTNAKSRGMKVSRKEEQFLVEVIRKPRASIKEGLTLASSSMVSSCMDNSDGFAQSILTLATESRVGMHIDAAKIPLHELTRRVASFLGIDVFDLAFAMGGEFNLVGTIKRSKMSNVDKYDFIRIVGDVFGDRKCFLRTGNKSVNIGTFDRWEHFSPGKKRIIDRIEGGLVK
jgi:thiamine-monophosphate kinase